MIHKRNSPPDGVVPSSPDTPIVNKTDKLAQMRVVKELLRDLDKLIGRASRPDAVTLITPQEFA